MLSHNGHFRFIEMSLGNKKKISTAIPARNAIATRGSRCIRWCFTLNGDPSFVKHTYASLSAVFVGTKSQQNVNVLCMGLERGGETNRLHIQGYVEFVKRVYRSGARKFLDGAHWEPAKGTRAQAVKYCCKDGVFHKFNCETALVVPGKRNDLVAVYEMAGKGKSQTDILDSHPATWIRYRRSIQEMCIMKSGFDVGGVTVERKVIWCHGPTGSGKSWYGSQYAKAHGYRVLRITDSRLKWFDGYCDQEVVIFDDWRLFETGKNQQQFTKLLQICDVYPQAVEVKGGYVPWRAKVIIFTTPRSIQETFEDAVVAHGSARKPTQTMSGMGMGGAFSDQRVEPEVDYEDWRQVRRRVHEEIVFSSRAESSHSPTRMSGAEALVKLKACQPMSPVIACVGEVGSTNPTSPCVVMEDTSDDEYNSDEDKVPEGWLTESVDMAAWGVVRPCDGCWGMDIMYDDMKSGHNDFDTLGCKEYLCSYCRLVCGHLSTFYQDWEKVKGNVWEERIVLGRFFADMHQMHKDLKTCEDALTNSVAPRPIYASDSDSDIESMEVISDDSDIEYLGTVAIDDTLPDNYDVAALEPTTPVN